MFLKAIKKALLGNNEPRKSSVVAEQEDIPRYPPFAKGLPAADTKRILETQSELIIRIRGILRFNPVEFAETVNPVIENYAAYVHLLPASETHHHRGAGGLFRHGLEVGFWAAQQAEAHQFCIDETPRNKRDNEPRWQFAAFLGGLLHDVGKPLSDVAVTNKDGSKEWNPYENSLATWAITENVEHYFLRWREKRNKRHEKFSMMNLDQIITQKAKTYLNKPGPKIMESLLESIVGTSAQETLTQLVLWADQESVRRDLVNQRMDVDEFSYGVPVERFVFDALRRLGTISKINKPGATIWRTEHGVFLAWKSIVTEVHNLIEKDKIPGIPRNHDTLADILIERGFAIPYQETTESKPARYWNIYPECLEGIGLMCLRIDDIELIFPNEPPAPIKASLSKPIDKAVVKEESNVVSIDKKAPQRTGAPVHASLDDYSDMEDMVDIDEQMSYAHEYSLMSEQPIEQKESKGSVETKPKSKETVKEKERPSINKMASVAAQVETEVGELLPNLKENNNKQVDKPKEYKSTVSDKKSDEDKPVPKIDEKPAQRQGPAWEIINKAIEITGLGNKKPILIKLHDGDYGIPYPNAARQLGEPRDIMNLLADDNLLRISPIVGTKTATIEGEKYLVIESKATKYINGRLSNFDISTTKPNKNTNKDKSKKSNKQKKEQVIFDENKFKKDFLEQIVAGYGCYINGDVEVIKEEEETRYSLNCKQTLEKICDYYNWSGRPGSVKIYLKRIKGIEVTDEAITLREVANEK